MPIPDYQALMLPLLRLVKDGNEQSLRKAYDLLADEFKLTEVERKEQLPSGQDRIFSNRVRWARFYLSKAGLLDSSKRGHFRITTSGLDLLAKSPATMGAKQLMDYAAFRDFKQGTDKPDQAVEANKESLLQTSTPEEAIEAAYAELQSALAAEILDVLKKCTPGFFEQIVVDVLVAMGYGGTRKDAGAAIGGSGDGGIDGVINEDRLGLDAIYVQAKRWDANPVGRPELQKFVGALQGQKAKKGIFITTSSYTSDAKSFATHIETRLVLIDGPTLARYMIEFNVGVATTSAYELKKVDVDYFSEE